MDNAAARVMGGIYIAMCKGLGEEGAKRAHEELFNLASSPILRPEDQRYWQALAECASGDIEQIRAEQEKEAEEDENRPRFALITGGAA